MGVVLASPWANLGTITSAFWASVFSAENLKVCSSGSLQLFKFVNKAQMSAFPFLEDLHLRNSFAAERVAFVMGKQPQIIYKQVGMA